MTFMSIVQIEQGLKRGIYQFLNQANGCALVWDAERRKYVGHVEQAALEEAKRNSGITLLQWVGYGEGSEWGSSGW